MIDHKIIRPPKHSLDKTLLMEKKSVSLMCGRLKRTPHPFNFTQMKREKNFQIEGCSNQKVVQKAG